VGGYQASLPTAKQRLFWCLSPLPATANRHFVRFALGLAAAALIGLGSPVYAQGQLFWPDADVYVEAPPPPPAARRQPHRTKHHRLAKSEAVAKGARKPKGPLIIAISIDRQTLKIYDANGFFAETPVSTGMRGHSTPLGVFSVIQKQKWHRSNIYSGAPMPYMQRITWSGIAMHAGVLPGYPASHGCIRMPASFDEKMFGWTRMGARVIVTPGEVTPADFSHPMLMTHRPEPSSVASTEPAAGLPLSPKADKDSTRTESILAGTAPQSATENQTLAAGKTATSALSDGKTRTAAASGALPQLPVSSGIIDPPAGGDAMAAAKNIHAADAAVSADSSELRSSIGLENKSADANKANTTADADKPQTADASPAADVTVAVKDQSQMPLTPASDAATEPAPALKRSGRPIAVFVSRKDSKIYVRQNFTPLFDAPVTITTSDRPLGTHVFTAEADKDNKDNFHWSVVSLPATPYRMERVSARGSSSHHRRMTVRAGPKPAPVPDSAADALNRITIPEDVMTKIAESLSTGGSIVVSDQGIAGGETGEGTDFIVTLR
jgi:hypothetical protein